MADRLCESARETGPAPTGKTTSGAKAIPIAGCRNSAARPKKVRCLVAKVFPQGSSMASVPLCIKTGIPMVAFLAVAFNASSVYRLEEASVLLLLFSLTFVILTAAVLACAVLYYVGKGLLQGLIAAMRFLLKVFVSSSDLPLGKNGFDDKQKSVQSERLIGTSANVP
jgi:hypothetical protein